MVRVFTCVALLLVSLSSFAEPDQNAFAAKLMADTKAIIKAEQPLNQDGMLYIGNVMALQDQKKLIIAVNRNAQNKVLRLVGISYSKDTHFAQVENLKKAAKKNGIFTHLRMIAKGNVKELRTIGQSQIPILTATDVAFLNPASKTTAN